MRLVDPSAAGEQPGPQLQALIDGIGAIQREDVNTDLLRTTNSPVQTMTPEEVNELTNPAQQPIDLNNNGNNPDVQA